MPETAGARTQYQETPLLRIRSLFEPHRRISTRACGRLALVEFGAEHISGAETGHFSEIFASGHRRGRPGQWPVWLHRQVACAAGLPGQRRQRDHPVSVQLQFQCVAGNPVVDVRGIVLLGASQTLRLNEHVRVDIIYSTISDRARLWVDILGITFFLLPVTFYLSYLTVFFFRHLVSATRVLQ